jgi:hypothetical protein
MDIENPNDSSNADTGRAPFQFSLKSLLLLPLWVAISVSAYVTLGKAAVPGIFGIICALFTCWITKKRRPEKKVVVVFYSFLGTLLGLILIRSTATIKIQDDWLYEGEVIPWIFLSFLFAILIGLFIEWCYLREPKD